MTTAATVPPREAHVLNVDDDAPSLYAKSRFLRRAGLQVTEASLGNAALEIVRTQLPDLVLLDVHLPDVNGIEVARRIKADPATASTIVVQISASYTEHDARIHGLDSGADAYLTEPIEGDELVANVRALLRLRRAEDEVRRAGVEWAAIFAASRDGLAILDRAGRVLRCNAAFESVVGIRAGETLPERAGDSAPELAALIERAQSGDGRSLEACIEGRWVRFALDAVRDAGGDKVACSAADVTAEHQLRDAHERVSAILASIIEARVVLDREWRIVEMNSVAEQMMGKSIDELFGEVMWVVYPGRNPDFQERYERAFETGQPIHFEAPSGIIGRWLEVHAYPRGDRIEVYYHDISDRKALEEKLRAAKEAAEAANHAKDEFLATVSHELRTPMTAILGWGQMLQMMDTDETVHGAAGAIVQAARAQSKLIDDILDTARIITGKLRIDAVPCDFAHAVHEAIGSITPAIRAKRLQLETAIVPVQVIADPMRLQQVAWNLLSNAVKFTPEGGRISVAVSVDRQMATLRVTDTGAGIAPELLTSIFDRFVQGEGAATGSKAGLGLGLAIVKHIVDLHGGEVSAMSEGNDRGATFLVRLPVA